MKQKTFKLKSKVSFKFKKQSQSDLKFSTDPTTTFNTVTFTSRVII